MRRDTAFGSEQIRTDRVYQEALKRQELKQPVQTEAEPRGCVKGKYELNKEFFWTVNHAKIFQ